MSPEGAVAIVLAIFCLWLLVTGEIKHRQTNKRLGIVDVKFYFDSKQFLEAAERAKLNVDRLNSRIAQRPKLLRPLDGDCPGCGVAENRWCRDDCTYLDPYDYR